MQEEEEYPYKLWEHLAPLSKNQSSFHAAVQEWDFYYLERIHHNGEDCSCGHRNIRNLFHIRNNITEGEMVVGSECIKWFAEHLSAVAEITLNMTAITGKYVGPTKGGYQLQFQVAGSHSVVTKRDIIQAYFGKASAYGDKGRWRIAVYDKRESDKREPFIKGMKYTLGIRPRNAKTNASVKSFLLDMYASRVMSILKK